ncbi:hypothetical protein BJV82DRAFT_408821 [Fennellomyces sp. T-0311]|nr:hypothetical protein BJV82DRAFT_408821 [Fennellomyces sp. T-0311]
MARSVHYYDSLEYKKAETNSPIPIPPAFVDPASLPPPTYALSSELSGFHTIHSVHSTESQPNFSFKDLLSSFLDTNENGNSATRARRNMPKLENQQLEIYQMLTITDFETDGKKIVEKIRTHEVFHGRKRVEYAVFRYDKEEVYGQTRMFFSIQYGSRIVNLCLAQRYTHVETAHATGLEVVKPALDQNYNGMFIAYANQIDRSVWIVPDFGSGKMNDNNLFNRYLVNTDADRFSWINTKGKTVKLPDRTYVKWTEE